MQHLSNVDLNLLVVLDAVLRERSVKAAAARIGRSPSATSHAVSRLRDLLDDPILVRAGTRMELTPRAQALRDDVRRVLDGIEALVRPPTPFSPASVDRTFRIAAQDYAEVLVLAGLSARVAATAPGVVLHALPGRHVADRLRSGELDLALSVVFDLPPDVLFEPLFDERFVCLVRRGHPVLDEPWTVDAYAGLGHVLIAPGGVPRGPVDVVLERLGLQRRVVRTASSFQAAPEFVARSDYVLTMASRIAEGAAERLGLVVLEPPVELPGFSLSMAWHRRDDADPAHAWLRDQVRAVCGP